MGSRVDLRSSAALAAVISLASCGADHGGGAPSAPPEGPDSGPSTQACVAPMGAPDAPGTVEEMVTLANALLANGHAPLTLPCLVESLARPLGVYTIHGGFSQQPSTNRSPRVFLFSDNLVVSVVPDGPGRDLLELSLHTSDVRSIKAEIGFPLTSLDAAEPYDRVRLGAMTTCAGCHPREEAAPQITSTQAFESAVLRPLPSQEIDLDFVRNQAATCDEAQEPERCAMLSAVFAHGTLEPRKFSDQAPTIYDN